MFSSQLLKFSAKLIQYNLIFCNGHWQHNSSLKSSVESSLFHLRACPIGYIIVLGQLEQERNFSEPPCIVWPDEDVRTVFSLTATCARNLQKHDDIN